MSGGRKSLKSVSSYDRLSEATERPQPQIPRPGSYSKLLNTLGAGAGSTAATTTTTTSSPKSPEMSANHIPRLTKLLLNVTIQRSLGPLHVVLSLESTVADLIRVAVETYVREGRRPLLTETDPSAYELHFSQFSLDSLDATDKLGNLGSRNFFLCPKPQNGGANTCSNQAKKAAKVPSPPWLKFMDFKL